MRRLALVLTLLGLATATPALAQSGQTMPGHSMPSGSAQTGTAAGGGHDMSPLYFFLRANRLDYGASQAGARASWDVDARAGTDENRIMLKTEGQYLGGKGENAEVQVLYDRPITEFFDFQVGMRQLFVPIGRTYFAIGVQGILPWFIDTEATIFVSTKGQPSARVKAAVDWAWTGQIYSRPSIELNAYGSDDPQAHTYAGMGTMRLALQTRYQVTDQFAPYVELGWEKAFGQTGNALRQSGERSDTAYAVVGLRLLY